MEPQCDQEIVELLKQGDHKAFEKIYNKYWERLYSVAFNWTNRRETSQELVQELFLKLWDKRENLHIYKTLDSYIFSFIKYLIYNYLLNRIGASNIRIYGTVHNLATLTNYFGLEPDIGSLSSTALQAGIDRLTYPQPRTFLVGVQVGF